MKMNLPIESLTAHRLAMPTLADVIDLIRESRPLFYRGLGYDIESAVYAGLSRLVESSNIFNRPTNIRVGSRRTLIEVNANTPFDGMSKQRLSSLLYLLGRKAATEGLYPCHSWGIPDVFERFWANEQQDRFNLRRVSYLDLDRVLADCPTQEAILADVRGAVMNAVSVYLEARAPGPWVDDLMRCVATQMVFAPDLLNDRELVHLKHFSSEMFADAPRTSPERIPCAFVASGEKSPYRTAQIVYLEGLAKADEN